MLTSLWAGCTSFPIRGKSIDQVKFRSLAIMAAWTVFGLYGILVASLLTTLDGGTFLAQLTAPRTLRALLLSLTAAGMATAAALPLALPAAWALARLRFRGQQMIDSLLELPLVISPAALGALLLLFFQQAPGHWIETHVMTVVFTATGVVVAQFFTVLGLAVRLLKAAIAEVPVRYEEVARTLGASSLTCFRKVTLPLARRGIGAAAVLTFAKAFGEFGATVMLAGAMAGRTETLPIALFLRFSTADIQGAAVMIALLLITGLGVLSFARWLAVHHA